MLILQVKKPEFYEMLVLTASSEGKKLLATTETKDKVKGRFLLNVVVRESTSIFKLFTSKDQPLLIWGNAFLVLDFGLDIFNGIRWFNLKSDGLASQGLDKNLHTSTKTENQMQSGLLLDVVVREGAAIFKLFASKDQHLLIWGNAFLVLDLSLDIFNGVRWFNLKCNGFASQSFDKNLHATTETENQMQSGLLLDVAVTKGATILKLFAGKDQSLLIWGNALFILNLGFDIFNGVRRLNLQCNCFTSQGFDKNLHTSSQSKYQMQSRLLLDVVVREGAAIFKLFASKDQPLLVWGNAFLVLDLSLDIFNGVRWL